MRLIDADKTIKELNDKIARLDAKQQIYMENGLTSIADSMARKIELCIECRELLEHQPTAYDVDKVVEQLESEREYAHADFEQYAELHGIDTEDDWFYAGMRRAIEVVKAGGTND